MRENEQRARVRGKTEKGEIVQNADKILRVSPHSGMRTVRSNRYVKRKRVDF